MRINLASVLSGRPLLITEHGLRLVFAVVSRDEFFAGDRMRALAARDGEELENSHQVEVRDGVAVIPVHGPLFRFASFFTEISGATSYDTLRKDLQLAVDDTNIKAILLDINSPGGDADGCGELADAIRRAAAIKPVWAYVGGMGASAAYWLATAAERVCCAPSAFLGSIGVRTAIVDTSKAEANAGVREIEIISSNAPGKRDRPVDDEIVAKVQKHVDSLEALFIGAVAMYRDTTPANVMANFGQGDVVIGGDAVAAGMADELSNFEDTLQALAAFASAPAGSTAIARAASHSMEKVTMSTRKGMRAEGTEPAEPMGKKAEGDDKQPGCDDEEPAKKADAADGDGDADEDDKKKNAKAEGEDDPTMEDDEKDEKAQAKALATKLGLSANASMKEILSAANATAVPLTKVSALVEKQVSARFAEEKKEREKMEKKERAEKLAAAAIRGGYDAADKAALVEFATSNYAAAERSVAHFLKNEKQLFARTVDATTDRPAASESIRVKQMGGVKIIKHGVDFAAEAKRLAAKENISIEAAQSKLMATKEGRAMYQAYLESLS